MRQFLAAFLLCISAPVAFANASVEQLRQLLEDEWQRGLRDSPETASYLGDRRYADRWTDWTPAAIEARHEGDRAALQRLARIYRELLPPAEQLNYDLFKRQVEINVGLHAFREFLMPVSPINWSGLGEAPDLARLMAFETQKDYADWNRRLQAYGALVDQSIALMRQGLKEGRTPPRVTMQRIPAQLREQLVGNVEDSPLYLPFKAMAPALPAATRDRLQAEAKAALLDVALPAQRRFLEFFEKEYLPGCRETIAATALPDGQAYYRLRVRQQTTTELGPEEIHGIGQQEVARIRGEMESIMQQVGFKGSLRDFFEHLRTDPKFFFKSGDELLDAYTVLAKRVDPQLVKLFGKLPRLPYGVRAVPEAQAPNATAAYYQPPADDGSRAGYFYANTYKPETRPRWEMEALTLHEAVPGHHFQIALARELGELPKFRRIGHFTAFVEGWGLYAESLGGELGFYADPYSKFGQLTYEMWRAIRLVLDTGIHAKGWTREQAIEFFKANAAKTENDIAVEVDRYIAWPGQALAYKLGELKIKELRARSATALGDKFDLRAFHDTVLGSGPLPLDVLERSIDAWVASQRAPVPAPAAAPAAGAASPAAPAPTAQPPRPKEREKIRPR